MQCPLLTIYISLCYYIHIEVYDYPLSITKYNNNYSYFVESVFVDEESTCACSCGSSLKIMQGWKSINPHG